MLHSELVPVVSRVDRQRNLEFLRGMRRQIEDPPPLVRFDPIPTPGKFDRGEGAPPTGDRRHPVHVLRRRTGHSLNTTGGRMARQRTSSVGTGDAVVPTLPPTVNHASCSSRERPSRPAACQNWV